MRKRTIIFRGIGGLLGASLAVCFLLPVAIDKMLVPHLFSGIPIDSYAIDLRRIGFDGIDLGEVMMGNRERPFLRVDSLRVDYSLPGVIKRKIDSIEISGLRLHAGVLDGKILLEGADMEKLMGRSHPATEKEKDKVFPGLENAPDHLAIRNSMLRLDYQGHFIRLPFDLEVNKITGFGDRPFLTGVCRFYPHGREVVANIEYQPAGEVLAINFMAADFLLDGLAGLLGVADLSLSGELNISGSATLTLNSFGLKELKVLVEPRSMAVGYGNVPLVNLEPAESKRIRSRIEIVAGAAGAHVAVSGLAFESPFPFEFPELDGDFRITGKTISGNGSLRVVSAAPERWPPDLRPMAPIKLDGRFTLEYSSSQVWSINLSCDAGILGESDAVWKFAASGVEIGAEQPAFDLALRADGPEVVAAYELSLPGLHATTASAVLSTPLASLKGEAALGSGHREKQKAGFSFTAPSTEITAGALAMRGDFSFDGVIAPVADERFSPAGFEVDGTARLSEAEMITEEWQLGVTELNVAIPLRWPVVENMRPGSVSALARWRKSDLGNLVLVVRQQTGGFSLAGSHESLLLPGMRLDFEGDAGYEAGRGLAADIAFQIPLYNFSGLRLGELLDIDQTITVDGQLEVAGKVSTAGGINRGTMQVGLKEGRLARAGSETLIEGVELDLAFDDLFALRSKPGQRLSFLRASLGELSMQAGRIDFQIESPRSLLVERSSVRWCSGLVNSNAVRFMPGRSDYSISLYCDRLNLSEILEQFGVSDARGQGTVNGLLPFDFADGEISFKGGYLYSSPGEDGHVQVAGTGNLLAGVPKGSPQFMQLDFAMAAMKDFSYDWVKMSLDTEADDLLLKLRLNGKPASPLPFRYDSKQGLFVRYSGEEGKGLWQPILLDVNFRLPLNRILEYSNGINDLLNRWH